MNGRIVTNDPKTSGSKGTIAIGPGLVAALGRHQANQKQDRLLVGGAWQDSGYVFVREDGTPLRPQQITRMFSRLVKAAGVPGVRLHDLRHTSATLLLEAGIPLKVVQERLRRASFTTTADLYAYVTAGMQQQAAATIEALLRAVERRQPPAAGMAAGE